MFKIIVTILACLCGIPLTAAQQVYTNGQIVDPETRTIRRGTIFVDNGKVTKVKFGRLKSLKKFNVIDLENKYIIPGLFDMHVHAYGNQSPLGPGMIIGTEAAAKLMLYAGITGFLDLFNNEIEIFPLRNRQRNEGLIAADIYAAGAILTSPGGHGTEYPIPGRVINSPEGGVAELLELSKLNPDVVKLVYHTDPNDTDAKNTEPNDTCPSEIIPRIDFETLKATLNAANEKGIKSVVHIGSWKDTYEAIEAGATVVTHFYSDLIPDKLVDLAKEKNTIFIPTLGLQRTMLDIVQNPELLNDPLLREVTTDQLLSDYLKIGENDECWQDYFDYLRKARSTYAESIKKLHDAGIKILPGSDAGGIIGMFLGYTLHRELELLVSGGMSTWDVLKAATIDSADFLGEKYGFKPGSTANFLVLDKSPVRNIQATKDIVDVIYKGKIVDRSKLINFKANSH